jgi:phosphoserine phosphatase
MDGVIFEGRNFWLDLHREMHTEAEALRLWESLGHRDYAQLGAFTVDRIWRGRSADAFFALIASRRYVVGVSEVFAWFRVQGIRTAIVTSGPYQLAERAQHDLQVDRILGNRVGIVDGRFAGTVELFVDENHKDQAARNVMADFGIAAANTAIVGDGLADARMAAIAGLPIAYDPEDEKLAAAVHAVIPAGHLADLIGIISSAGKHA